MFLEIRTFDFIWHYFTGHSRCFANGFQFRGYPVLVQFICDLIRYLQENAAMKIIIDHDHFLQYHVNLLFTYFPVIQRCKSNTLGGSLNFKHLAGNLKFRASLMWNVNIRWKNITLRSTQHFVGRQRVGNSLAYLKIPSYLVSILTWILAMGLPVVEVQINSKHTIFFEIYKP